MLAADEAAMAPHVCTLLFNPRREDWAQLATQLASSRWCVKTASCPDLLGSVQTGLIREACCARSELLCPIEWRAGREG